MKLRVLSTYSDSRGITYGAGIEIVVADAYGQWLLSDSPGSFVVVEAPAAQVPPDAPPVDKMVKRARRK